MRRLVKHAAAGVAFAGLTVAAGVAVLGSPVANQDAIAVPAPLVFVAPSTPSPSAVDPAVTAEQVARAARESREAQRAELSAAVVKAAGQRQTVLGKQSKAITVQQAKIKSDRAKAKAEAEAKARADAAAAKKARALVLKNRGYEPGTTDPREIARQILKNKYGYGADQYSCFNYIIMRESTWKINATNPSSGAYGIPQALPGSKMASAGSDWRTNPATQIIWGIDYMKDRYGSPCSAKGFKASHGWY